MNKLSKPEVVLNAVQRVKASEFGATAIKIELEANLYRKDGGQFEEENDCYDWLMTEFAELGLAEYRPGDWHDLSEHDDGQVSTEWHVMGPLVYADFYNDGSVDSELTLTVALDNAENVLLLPKIVKIWDRFMQAVSEETGMTPEVNGAGMHMAFLNSPTCTYPTRFQSNQLVRYENFRRSMGLLLPALYFLASSDDTSRPLQYREPKVTMYDGGRSWDDRRMDKFSAITYNQGALEFRVFNTCYDHPEVILDNFVVMSNAVCKYWRKVYRDPGMSKITRRTRFGNEMDSSLARLYVSVEHIDLLNEGLKKLKPSYYTIRELKEQRQFRLSKRTFSGLVSRIRKEARLQYKEYENRFDWDLRAFRYEAIATYLTDKAYEHRNRQNELKEDEVIQQAEKVADAIISERKEHKQSLEDFVQQQVREQSNTRSRANWDLVAS